LAADRLKLRVDDELCRHWIAADMALAKKVKLLRMHLAQNVPEIEIGLGDFLDITATNIAEIALFADRHAPSLEWVVRPVKNSGEQSRVSQAFPKRCSE